MFLGINQGVTVFEKAGAPIPPSIDVSPDPSLDSSRQIHVNAAGSLELNESLQWLTDFDKALAIGMAIKISQADLTNGTIPDGFDQLMTIGINMKTDADQTALELQALFQHQYYTKKGFGLVPQGTPTNNTESNKPGFSRDPDAEESYARVFDTLDHYTITDDPWAKKDGQWLAEYLGLDPLFFSGLPAAGGNDQGQARAMNSAMWPGTMGYFMDEMMDGVFKDADIINTRKLFNEYVTGRGAVPSIRMGKQPYGILPATRYSKLVFETQDQNRLVAADPSGAISLFLTRLHGLLLKMDVDWKSMATKVPEVVSAASDPLQRMLSIIGLQSGSVEFHQRYAESEAHVYNEGRLSYGEVFAAAIAGAIQEKAKNLLFNYGLPATGKVPILSKLFLSRQTLLQGDVVDDSPLDEVKPVRNYSADNKNYIQWLADSSLSQILAQDFGGNKAPASLLYLMLRHAKMEQYHRTSMQLYEESRLFPDTRLAMREPDLLFVSAKETGTSKLKFLYDAAPAITSKPAQTVADYIHSDLQTKAFFPNYYLSELNRALVFLSMVPTAKLERVFTEHLDCCGYRFDAWIQGLTQYRLREQRVRSQNHGIYLGAYGYVENLRPQKKQLSPVRLDDKLDKIFNNDPALPPLLYDSTNAGYIHAPSINQATAAAVLKNAYIAHSTSDQPDIFAINLSSERVRLAQNILDGIRNGQSLSALLGYRFERALHDKHSLGRGEVDVLIYPMRMAFPLVSKNIIQDIPAGPDGEANSIEQLEARNVLDGLKLINHVAKTGINLYPFGLATGTDPGQLPAASALQQQAINNELKNIQDVNDAVSDMLLSETVYQAIQGNYERSAANSDAASNGAYPPETEIIQTPRSGVTCTHRVALHLDALAVSAATPRAIAEPAINDWINKHLPDFPELSCRVEYYSPDLPGPVTVTVKMAELNIAPIDLLYVFNPDSEQAMSEMDDRISFQIRSTLAKHPAATVKALYTEPVSGKISFFDIASLMSSICKVLIGSRYADEADLIPSGEGDGYSPVMDESELITRITNAKDQLELFLPQLQTIIGDLGSGIDAYAGMMYDMLFRLSLYGLPQTGTGFIASEINRIYSSVKTKSEALVDRWEKKNIAYTDILAGYAVLTTDTDRFTLLQKAEREISTGQINPLPANPLTFKNDLENFRTTQFGPALGAFRNLTKTSFSGLKDFLDAAEPLVKNETGRFDFEFFDTARSKNDIDAERKMNDDFRQSLTDKSQLLFNDIDDRIKKTLAALTDSNAAPANDKKIRLLLDAAKLLLGDSFRLIPRFTLTETVGSKVSAGLVGSASLLSWLKASGKKYPVDDWLYGAGRVREKLFHWENIAMLGEGFGLAPLGLTPVQLPFQAGDHWLALEFPDALKPDTEKLLYTAHFSKSFNKAGPQCGLILDEWVEVIPGTEETTGISFHYDRPNTEPPQAMLLVTPASFRGHWEFQDIVETIRETFDLARKRCVDPAMIDTSDYAQLLPATMMGVTLNLITMSTSLAINNRHLTPIIQK